MTMQQPMMMGWGPAHLCNDGFFGGMYGGYPMGASPMSNVSHMDGFGAHSLQSKHDVNDSVTFIQKLGSGVFGEVWKAEYRGELVAAKFTRCPTGFRDEEVSLLRRAQGDHTVRLIAEEHGTPKGTAIIMELCEGSLNDQVELAKAQREPKSVDRFLHELCTILEGVTALHEQGIMFGDLKPDNLLVQGDQLLFADFGDARDVWAERRARPVHEEAWGSPMYHARPDVMRQKLSCASDMWMFAQTAIHMWDRQAAKVNPSPLPEDIPLRELFEACHQQDPAKRPSAREALEVCREWIALGFFSDSESPPSKRSMSNSPPRSPSKSPAASPTKKLPTRSPERRRASLSESPSRDTLSPTSFDAYRRRHSLPGPAPSLIQECTFDGSSSPRREEEQGFMWQSAWMMPPPPPQYSQHHWW